MMILAFLCALFAAVFVSSFMASSLMLSVLPMTDERKKKKPIKSSALFLAQLSMILIPIAIIIGLRTKMEPSGAIDVTDWAKPILTVLPGSLLVAAVIVVGIFFYAKLEQRRKPSQDRCKDSGRLAEDSDYREHSVEPIKEYEYREGRIKQVL